MENLDIEKFDPTKEELMKIVKESQKITVGNIKDKTEIDFIHKCRKELRAIEIRIEKTGKSYRQGARDLINKVLEKEHELKAITTPEIERLKAIEDESEKLKIKENRMLLLPNKKERLAKILDDIKIDDDFILGMDDMQFEIYYSQRITDKLEKDRLKIENEKIEKEREAKKQIEIEEARKQAEEKAKLEYERKLQEQKEKLEREKRENEQRKIRDEEARKQAELEEKERMEKDGKYKKFLKDCNYNDKDFKIERIGNKIICYKKVGEINL